MPALNTDGQNTTLSITAPFFDFFLKTYVSAYYVCLNDMSCKIIKRTAELEKDYPILTDYYDSLLEYIGNDVHPDDRDALLALVSPERMRDILSRQQEFSHVFRDISGGVEKYYRMQVLRGGDENHVAFGFKDITGEFISEHEHRHQLENALAKAKKLSTRNNILLDIIHATKLSFRFNANDELTKISFGDREYNVEPSMSDYPWVQKIHPDDRAKVLDAFNATIKDHTCNTPYQLQYRVSDMQGGYLWIQAAGRIVRDDEGNGEFFGIHTDVTETVKEEQKRILGAIPLSSDVLVKANIGLWSFEMDEGKAPRMYVDQAMLGLIGLDRQIPPEETYHAWYDNIDKDSYGIVSDSVAKMIAGEHAEVQYPWHHPDGRTMIVRCGGVRNPEYTKGIRIEGTHQDVTEVLHFEEEQSRVLRELAEQQLRLKSFSDMINAASWSFEIEGDADIISCSWSDAFRKMFGFESVEDFPNTKEAWSDRLHPDDKEDALADFDRSIRVKDEGLVYDIRYRIQRKTGEYVWYHALGRMRVHEGSRRTFYGIITDISSDKQIEEQQKQLQEALALAQSASKAKTTFLNNMSHDIRTPMNAIIGYTGLAATHINNKDLVQDYLRKISQSSDHLLSLINDVLDMSRIESGKMNINENPENIADIIHTLRSIVQHDINAKQLDFFVDAVDVHDENVICDKLRLNQVLLNILSNAIKYTPSGGMVTLRVKEKAVKEKGKATYEFICKDSGIGMSEEFLKTVFDPFTRMKSSTVSGIQGTGLGMAITKSIVDMMDGEINIKSVPNKGTEVSVTLDFKLQSAPMAPVKIPELEGFRALVVDDNSSTCLSIGNMLREIGMRDEWCVSGKEAVIRAAQAYKRGEPFKVYIIDWLMPDLNGIETTRRMRKVIGDGTPIIILTAYDWSDIEEEALEAGVTAFISKPLFPSDLHDVLERCLGKNEDKTLIELDTNIEGKKILLVEDNELNREIATAILEEFGAVVSTAEDGDIAVEKMRTAQEGDYDIILMDIQMPTIDGYEATRQIRDLGISIPILAMTANAFEEDRQLALKAGMNDHIAKPIDIDKLRETLAKYI